VRSRDLLNRVLEAFEAEDDPAEPKYDPFHLGAALLLALTAVGALYWMLWTLLVYEGGLFAKILPAAQVALRLKTAADFGWRGPWDRGVFEGWAGNLGALVACVLAVTALHRLYAEADRRARARK
jgi:hypothetical protein